jgi:hypothetical protein
MNRTISTMLTAATMLIAAVIGLSTSAKSQTVIIIGNGSAPYYPYPYSYPPRVYSAPTVYAEPGYSGYGYAASGYYAPSYGYYRPYGWGYRRYWGW